jgi:dipeptidase E
VLFVPHALADLDGYTAKARQRFERLGFELDSLHEIPNAANAVDQARAIFVGGGNTFRLLASLARRKLLPRIRSRVRGGELVYVGSSAGTNLACPTIKTTNDMPIVEPPSFVALGLVPFQINPHYVDPDPLSTHMGETREERILQFLEEKDTPVVGLREGAMLRVERQRLQLAGTAGARIFRRGQDPLEAAPGTVLTL